MNNNKSQKSIEDILQERFGEPIDLKSRQINESYKRNDYIDWIGEVAKLLKEPIIDIDSEESREAFFRGVKPRQFVQGL